MARHGRRRVPADRRGHGQHVVRGVGSGVEVGDGPPGDTERVGDVSESTEFELQVFRGDRPQMIPPWLQRTDHPVAQDGVGVSGGMPPRLLGEFFRASGGGAEVFFGRTVRVLPIRTDDKQCLSSTE
jgi:hypothetical protein